MRSPRALTFDPEEADAILRAYHAGASLVVLARRHGVSDDALRRWFHRRGLRTRSQREASRGPRPVRREHVPCACGRMVRWVRYAYCIRCADDLAAGRLIPLAELPQSVR